MENKTEIEIDTENKCDKLFESLYDIIRTDKQDMEPEVFLNVYNNVKNYITKFNTIRNELDFDNKFIYDNGYTIKDNYDPVKKKKKYDSKIIKEDENGVIKSYISARKCALSKYKEIQYAIYKSYDLEEYNYKHFNKVCCSYWKKLKDSDKINHLNNKIAIPIENYK